MSESPQATVRLEHGEFYWIIPFGDVLLVGEFDSEVYGGSFWIPGGDEPHTAHGVRVIQKINKPGAT